MTDKVDYTAKIQVGSHSILLAAYCLAMDLREIVDRVHQKYLGVERMLFCMRQ